MTVEQLIEQLSKIIDKTQRVKFFNNEFEDGQDLQTFNLVKEVRYEGEEIVILEWKD